MSKRFIKFLQLKRSKVRKRSSCILLLLSVLFYSSYALPQQITLNRENASFISVLNAISKQTKYHFFYEKTLLEDVRIPSINVRNKNIHEVLDLLFADKNLSYKIVGNTVSIAPKEELRSIRSERVANNQVLLTGKVTDYNGLGLATVTVTNLNTNKSTASNQSGDFSLEGKVGDVLLFSIVGYKNLRITVINAGNIGVRLEEEDNVIEEVAVVSTGYQTINRKHFTGAATTVKMDDIKIEGMTDVSRMLEGRVAGVSVQNVSGAFGSAPKLRVRGATSITGDNKPLWVVDGVVLEDVVNISNDQLSSGDALTLVGSSVAGINTEDIESLEILKDASATAMYGARAMNGVVVITTKKGRAGKPQVNYSGNYSTYLKPSYNSFNIMNSVDQMSVYLEMERKGLLNFSSVLRAANGGVFNKMYQLIDYYDETNGQYGLKNTVEDRANFLKRYAAANTDWFDILFNNSFVQEHTISTSSGTENIQHYFSGSFFNDNGWTIADKVKRYTANMRSDYKFNEKLSANAIISASIRDQDAPGTQGRLNSAVFGEVTRDFDINPYSYALNTSRTLTAYEDNGDLEFFNKGYSPFNIIHELGENKIRINVMDIKGQGEAAYKFLPQLEYRALGSFRFVRNTREHMATEYSNMANAYRVDGNGDALIIGGNSYLYDDPDFPNQGKQIILPEGGFYLRNNDIMKSFYARHTLSYQSQFADVHRLSAFVGQELRYADRQNDYFNGYGYQYYKGGVVYTDYRIIKQAVENNYSYFGLGYGYDRFISFFSNVNYAYDSRYVLNLTGRYDGSNRMGRSSSARYLPTWTLSAAWNVDEEDFMKDVDAITYLKLRGTYGLTASMGNATNTSVVYQNTLTKRPTLADTETMIEITSLENSDLTWEKQHEANLGLDLGLFNSRVHLNVDLYKRNSFDLINTIVTSGVGGQSSKIANYADMDSKGLEFTLGGRIYSSEAFSYRTNLTFGYNTNTIRNMKSTPSIWTLVRSEGGSKEGYPVKGLYSIVMTGLDHLTGVPTFINHAGEEGQQISLGTANTSFLKYEGYVDPTITGGFNNTFTYKGLSLNVFISYQTGNKIRLDSRFKATYTDLDAMPNEFKDRWMMPGDEAYTNIPSIISPETLNELGAAYPYNYYNYSDARVVDGSFVRLKTIALNYAIPTKLTEKLGVKHSTLAFNANNIALLYADKELRGQDPEFFNAGGVAHPMPKQFTLTLKLGL